MGLAVLLQRRKLGRKLRGMGLPKETRAHRAALEFSLNHPKYVVEELHPFTSLSYQHPYEFEQELDAISAVNQRTKNSAYSPFRGLDSTFQSLEHLISIYGPGERAGNVLKAIAGIRAREDGAAEAVHEARSRLSRRKAENFSLQGGELRAAKSHDEFLTGYVFSLRFYDNLGFCNPSSCYGHIADLARRHPRPDEYRKRLEGIMDAYAREYFRPHRKYDRAQRRRVTVLGQTAIVTHGIPSVAFLAEKREEKRALERINAFTARFGPGGADGAHRLLEEVMHTATVCSRDVKGLGDCLDAVADAAVAIRDAKVKPFPPSFGFAEYFERFVGSSRDFKDAVGAAQGFLTRLGAGGYEFPPLDEILTHVACHVPFKDAGQFSRIIKRMAGDLLRFPYHDGRKGLNYVESETYEKIAKRSSTPAELLRNSRIYGRLANGLEGVPQWSLFETLRRGWDFTEDELLGAVLSFYGKIKDDPVYQFREDDSGKFASTLIWGTFIENNYLPQIIALRRRGGYGVRLELGTRNETARKGLFRRCEVTRIEKVNVEVLDMNMAKDRKRNSGEPYTDILKSEYS